MAEYRCFVAGQTSPVDFTLKDGASAHDLTGYTAIELILRDRSGVAVDVAGDVTVVNAAAGKVRYTPDAADLAEGVYLARWKVTDGGGVPYYWPGQDQPDVWIVGPVTS
jgi:hypothetical protein